MPRKREAVGIRPIKKDDIESAGQLLARLKRLNGEFDPLLKTIDKVETEATKSIERGMSSEKTVILVAVAAGRVVGFVKAEVRDRIFYEPRIEGAIVAFYILPEFRRGGLGNRILSAIMNDLRKRGARLVTAEFPSQNEIASRFYTKLGFRSLTNLYAKSD
ncbi:MAG: GNAT family N-acetyltransferase [Nitrososphaerota archaeon]|nr:GNAT family N-acetyltransferase [Nitrososphaerota archaeon]